MIIYRFRITSEDQEDFFREIEIQPSQTFLDFHDIIINCSDLMFCEDASFYTTDNHYKKKKEITLKKQQKQRKRYDEEMDEMVTETYMPSVMEKSKIRDFVEDPHQRMVYEFFGKSKFFFFIDLFRIIKTEELISLPRCTGKKGELPKKMDIIPAIEEEEEDLIKPVPAPTGTAAILAGIMEDESEIEEIESNIEEILEEEDAEAQVREPGEMEEQEEEDEDRIESLDEYDDLEDLENKSRGFGGESDDY
ncbi:MAG: IS1096 element passenger TnpR family protein [Syntrophothermus sp.]